VTVVELREGDRPVELALPAEVGQLLAASGVVTATPTVRAGRWLVAPTTKVGVVRVNDVEVWIRPKIDIRRLVFLLGYAQSPRGWRDSDVPLAPAADLVTAVAYAFVRQAERATAGGLLQGYRTVEDTLTVVRGRIREADQLRQRFGLPLPLDVTYDEFTVDIAENQLLRTATERLLQLPRLSPAVRQSLRRLLFVAFADVSPLPGPRPTVAWQPTRLNTHYQVAVRLAEMLLAAQSFEHQRGSVRSSGFLFDMAIVFEDFVCVALREALADTAGRVHLQYRTHLDEAAVVDIRPDLVITSGLRPVAVLDAKYKAAKDRAAKDRAEKPAGFPQADLYQMLAYCTVLGLRTGHLVYARGGESPARHRVTNADVTLVCHALDLDQDPAELLGDVARLAAVLVADPQGSLRQS